MIYSILTCKVKEAICSNDTGWWFVNAELDPKLLGLPIFVGTFKFAVCCRTLLPIFSNKILNEAENNDVSMLSLNKKN